MLFRLLKFRFENFDSISIIKIEKFSTSKIKIEIELEFNNRHITSVSVREHISRTAGPIFTKCSVQIPCGRGLVLLWRHCTTLCTSGFMNDVMTAVMGRVTLRGMPEP